MTDRRRPPHGSVAVARLGRSHGLEGVVRVHPTDDAAQAALAAAPRVWVDGLGEATVQELKPHGAHLLLRLDRVRRVEVAKELVNATVRVLPGDLPEDLAGALQADPTGHPVRVDGRPWGEVVAVEGSRQAPLLRVRGASGDRLLPLAAAYVRVGEDGVDVDDAPAGLLDDD